MASAEEYMTAFALGSEIRELLNAPDDPGLLEKGQQYTEDFAAVKGIFEGLYISTPSTYVLTHTSEDAIGITTRSGESLNEFQNTILAEPQLTNLGIMKSPGTGSMIISMYYPLFEGENCIGYVGAGVYASRLMDSLLNLDIEGLPNSEYVFLNVESGTYLYHQDDTLLNTETTDSGYQEIIRRIKADGNTQAGTYTYQDEIGMIAQTIHHVCDCLRKTIDDISRILGEMADGNIAVDVTKNEFYYIGDFRILADSLKSIRTHLTDVMRDITHIAHQVNSGANQVSAEAQALSQGTLQRRQRPCRQSYRLCCGS